MSGSRYDHTNTSGGSQDQGERKDDGWQSRQGGKQSREPGPKHDAEPHDAAGQRNQATLPPPGTNTQGELAGIREASRETLEELDPSWRQGEDAPQGGGGREDAPDAE
jgi:hypothetical protein